jgi:glycosyltransferase involved in cell wall biosynthesis
MNPLVSILIPVYNAEKWLAATLRSAINQTWTNKEIIVVDDGSNDNSLAVARSFECSVLKVAGEPHRGQTATLNRALALAQGDYIQYLDADDLLAPDKVEIQVKRLVAEQADAVATSRWARFYNDDLSTARFASHSDYRDYDCPVDWLIQAWNGRGTMPPVAWLFSRTVVEKAGPWDERLSLNNDTEYFTRAVLASAKIAFCSDAVGYYRSGNPSLSGRRDRRAIESYFLVCRLCVDELLAFEDSPRTRHACASLWQFFAYSTYPDFPEFVAAAEAQVRSLGGTELQLSGSPLMKLAMRATGWKVAKRMQRIYRSFPMPWRQRLVALRARVD